VGLKDIVVIDTGDAVLVVSRDNVQEVRKVVDELKRRKRTELT
jgi:mannose-1-phosphate guanylyltransferase